MTGIELLQKIKDNKIKEGTKLMSKNEFWFQLVYTVKKDKKNIRIENEEGEELKASNLLDDDFDFEVIDNKEENREIEELKKALNKLNETFDKAYNKLIKESEEK